MQYLKRKQFVYLLCKSGTTITFQSLHELSEKARKAPGKGICRQAGVIEQLKAENQLEWVGKMNNIRSRAVEIIDVELICV